LSNFDTTDGKKERLKMSKLIEKLTKLRQAEPQPMGFMTARAVTEKPRMQMVAAVTADILDTFAPEIAKADALLLELGKAEDITPLEKAVQLKDIPVVGGQLKTGSSDTLVKALKSGCDFIVFSTDAPLAVTKDEKLGKILMVETGLSDILLRTIGDLPVDAVIALEKGVEETLTVNRLMNLQRLQYLINKPWLVTVPVSFSVEELQALYDMGVAGVVVKITDLQSAQKLADLHEAIEKLKKTAPRKKDKMSAIIPRLQAETPQIEEEEEEEDE
jgi:hypothetical protein